MRATRLLLLIVLLAAAAPAYAKSYHFSRIDITAEVARDGSMHVRETRTFVFSGEFHRAYRDTEL